MKIIPFEGKRKKSQENNQNAQIYTDYYDKVLRYVRHHINSYDDAEDVVSDIFLKIYSKLDTFDESKASMSTWIYTITRNEVVDYYRKRRLDLSLDELPENTVADNNNNLDEMLEDLADLLQTLPEKQRDAVILFYVYGLSHKEISQRMDISYDSARKYCSMGIIALREKLNVNSG